MREETAPGEVSRQQRLQELSPAKRAYLARLLGRTAPAERLPIEPRAHPGAPVPSSYAQQRLWVLDRLDPGSAAYTTLTTLRLEGGVEAAALAASLTALVARHEVLRTTFVERDGQPYQVVGPPTAVPLAVVDLAAEPAATRRAAASRQASAEARRGFDLTRGPLLRATLVRLDDDEAVLLLAMHHIVTDGWSMGVLLDELRQLYAATRAGTPGTLPPLPIQYADFAVWQRTWVEGPGLAAHLAYWRQHLAAPATLALPTDRPRPAVVSYRGGRVFVTVPRELTAAVRAWTQRAGGTLFMALLAAFQVLLARYTGQVDIVVGSPTANRTRAELEGLIGFFVNTLVMRTDLTGDPSFAEVLQRVRRVALEAYAHQEVPFERLVEELQPARDLSRNPLFQVTFQLQNASSAVLRAPGGTERVLDVEPGTALFDLAFDLWETDEGLSGQLEYNSDLFDRGTIERLAGHYLTLLAAAVAAPETAISRLPLLPAAERAALLRVSAPPPVRWPATSVPALVAHQAARTPQALAVADATTRLDYATLNQQANRLARRLSTLGVQPDQVVGVCLERSPRLVVALLAVLKAGAAYLPLDPTHPPARLAALLADAQARVVVSGAGVATALPRGAGRVVCDVDDPTLALERADDLPDAVAPESLAYVIYTSGSTGTPKGVDIEHRSLLNLVLWHQRTYGVTPHDRASQLASLSFDASVWELWPYLAGGASVHIVDDVTRSSPSFLVEWLSANRISVAFLPTPLAELVLDLEWPKESTLRWLLTGGDRLRARLRGHKSFTLVNHYGPTETTVVATAGVITADDDDRRPPHVGSAVANVEAYVLDPRGQLVPVGIPGELYIGGGGLARGYHNRPDLTRDQFVAHPFDNAPGSRLYRTGDMMRYRADGHLEFLGRLDNQVKIRGVRIEPGEIEGVLVRHPQVREVAVVALDQHGETQLVAYVVPADSPPADGGRNERERLAIELRTFIAQQLPMAFVPTAIVLRDALPLTAHGKLDRAALPRPELSRPAIETAWVAPSTATEVRLAQLWTELLGIDRVGIHDDFFALGGHSLLATRLMSRVRDALEVDLPLRRIFEMPTVHAMARLIDDATRDGSLRASASIAVVSRERYRATFSADGVLELPRVLRPGDSPR